MKYRRNDQPDCGRGRLPAAAPLANPYVPFQQENPPKYEVRRGLIRGTMYPGLDLPFQGRVNTKELNVTPMTELQALNFAIQDLQLYLDTHRCDKDALDAYRELQRRYRECAEQYQHRYGPMNQLCADDGETFRWLDDPWPWEYCKNKGV